MHICKGNVNNRNAVIIVGSAECSAECNKFRLRRAHCAALSPPYLLELRCFEPPQSGTLTTGNSCSSAHVTIQPEPPDPLEAASPYFRNEPSFIHRVFSSRTDDKPTSVNLTYPSMFRRTERVRVSQSSVGDYSELALTNKGV
jgi:hypothetical protein